MQIKRFTARSMSEALQLVKAELGPEAIILSARTVKKSGMFLDAFRKAGVEVTAALDAAQRAQSRQGSGHGRQSAVSPGRAWGRRAYESGAGGVAVDDGHLDSRGRRHSDRADKDDRLRGSWLYRHLISQDVRQEYALEISSELLAESAAGEFHDERLLSALVRALRKMGADARPLVSSGAKRVAFVGPAGAGKTSSAAKLAAIHAGNTGRQVAMISLDNYRVAATGQLQRCADIMGLPLVAAGDPEELRQALRRLDAADLIVIDTPALRRTDRRMLEILRDNLKAADVDDIHFVCSAARKEKDTRKLFATLKDIPINRLLFTKLDETASYGSLVNLLIQLQVPASGFSSGLQIPRSLQGAAVEKLAGLILSGQSPTDADQRHLKYRRERIISGQRDRKSTGKSFTANKNSSLFHTADCIWTRLIKKENRMVFQSAADALARKFKPCRDCCRNIIRPSAFRRSGLNRAKAAGACGNGSDAGSDAEAFRPETIPVRST